MASCTRLALVLLVISVRLAAAAGAAELRAEAITEATAPELLIGGPDAIGGIGDWYLANDVVEVIVDDPGRANATLNHGGTIVDAGLRDREGEDQFARLFPLVNLDQKVFLDYDAMRAEVDEEQGWARLVVSSSRGLSSAPRREGLARWLDPRVPDPEEVRDVSLSTEYRVFRGEPFVHITTTVRNEGTRPAPVFAYGDVWMRGGRSLRSFVGNTLAPERSRGFHHLSFDRGNILAAAGEAMAAFTHVSLPGMRSYPSIAYALFSPERTARRLPNFGVTGEHVTFVNAFTFDPDWQELDLLRIARATQGELGPGAVWAYQRRLLITGHADVASTTDVIFPLVGVADGRSGIAGRIEPAEVACAIHVEDALTGAPVTVVVPRAGSYEAVLPPGDYALRVRTPQRERLRIQISVSPGQWTRVSHLRLPEPGWLRFDPAFDDRGPGRIVVEGIQGTADPSFEPELLDFRIDGELARSGAASRELHFVGNGSDPRRVAIPPGHYRLTATRGPEYGIAQLEFEVEGPGYEVRVPPFDLRRAVELHDVVRGDFHVHAQASDDSGMTNEARLRSLVAEGLDLIVTSDHDHLGFYAPALAALGLDGRIRVLQGVEVTSSAPSPTAPYTIGHHNAWPIPYRPLEHRRGAPPSQNLGVADLYSLLRLEYGARVVQLNHPRAAEREATDEEAFFTHLGSAGEPFDPTRPLEEAPNRLLLQASADGRARAIDFDAMEVMNGRDFGEFLAVRDDWYALLRQGFRRTGTANSDSHGPDQPPGYPRNYVLLAPTDGASEEALHAAVREGRLFGTNGPLFTEFSANGWDIGDLAPAPGGDVVVRMTVAAAPWVPVDEVRLLVNGEVQHTWRDLPPPASGETVRFSQRAELALAGDAFLTLEAGTPLDVDPRVWTSERGGVYSEVVARRFVPAAFTNPIYVDADGNGRFDPPGRPLPSAGGLSPVGALAIALGAALVAGLLWRRRRA